jgi:hypothetical protein
LAAILWVGLAAALILQHVARISLRSEYADAIAVGGVVAVESGRGHGGHILLAGGVLGCDAGTLATGPDVT